MLRTMNNSGFVSVCGGAMTGTCQCGRTLSEHLDLFVIEGPPSYGGQLFWHQSVYLKDYLDICFLLERS